MPSEEDYQRTVLDAALLALSARIALDETAATTPEAVITELWENHFLLGPRRAAPGPHRLAVDNAVQLPGWLFSMVSCSSRVNCPTPHAICGPAPRNSA